MIPRKLCFLILCLTLAACGGGGGSGSGTGLQNNPLPNQPTITHQLTPVSITITIPGVGGSSKLRHPLYISSGTKSAGVVITPATGNPVSATANCTSTCNLNVTVPVGSDQFKVSLYDQQNGTGNVLSTGTVTQTITVNGPNQVNLVADGVISRITATADKTVFTQGTADVATITITAQDAAGNTIIGSDPYLTPIALTNSDGTGATSLAPLTLTSPNANTARLTYNGAQNVPSTITVSAAVQGGPPLTTVVITVNPNQVPVPIHISSLLYYGENWVNYGVPASYMAQYGDYTESGDIQPYLTAAYKAAGGKHALVYTDPTYIPSCVGPFNVPVGPCNGSFGNTLPESAFYHDSSGARIHRPTGSTYQEAFNVASTQAQGAYQGFTQSLVAATPGIDLFEADDSGGTLAMNWYGFNAPGVETTRDSDWIAAEKTQMAQAARPVIFNGVGYDWNPSYQDQFLTAPNVIGAFSEGCFTNTAGYVSDTYSRWQLLANAILDVTAHSRLSVCWMEAPNVSDARAYRLYSLASLWLTYDPTYTVAEPLFNSDTTPDGHPVSIFSEENIVPTNPVTTATSDIAVLNHGGVYAREFNACYESGQPIGPCATVVNPSAGSTHAIPALTRTYSKSLALSAASSYNGGTNSWVSGTPSSLAPTSAAILR